MKKRTRGTAAAKDDLRAEYVVDYSKAKPNPYAARLKGRKVAVVLDADVAAAFPTSRAVNTHLRSLVPSMKKPGKPAAA